MNKAAVIRLGPIYTALAVVACFFCFLNHQSGSIPYWILPVAYTINLIAFRHYDRYEKNISLLIIDILMLVRYAILPISYYASGQAPQSYCAEYEHYAFILMIYEMVAVTFLIDLVAPKTFREKKMDSDVRLPYRSGIGTFAIVVLFFAILALHPQYLRNLFTFRFKNFGAVEVDSDIDGMYNLIYKTGVIALGCWMLSRFKENGCKDNRKFIGCLLLSWLAMWMSSVGTSGLVSRTSFLTNGIIFTLIVMQSFPSKKRLIVTSSLVVVLFMILLGTASRFFASNRNAMIGGLLSYETLDSYFGGLRDVTVGLEMRKMYSKDIGLSTFFTDVFAGVPYFASRSGMNFSNRIPVYFNTTFFGFHGNVSRICPIIVQGATYFSPLLSPIFSCISVYFAMYFNKALSRAGSYLEYYFYALFLYYLSTYSMYNVNIIMGGFWNKLLPIFLVLMLDRIDIRHGVKWHLGYRL